MNQVNEQDAELQAKAFRNATEGLPRVLAQRKRGTGLAVQFHPEHAARLNAGGLQLEEHPDPNAGADYTYANAPQWALFGVPINPGDYIVKTSDAGIRIITRQEFEQEWEVVGDA